MAERTLAEAIAELRLSDRKFASDFTLIRQRLLGAIRQVENDARITVRFAVDDDQIVQTFADLEQHAQDFAPTVKLKLDSDSLLSELANLPDLASDGLTIKVTLDATSIADEVATLNKPITPVVAPDVEEGEKDLASFASNAPPIAMGIVLDAAEADRAADTVKNSLPDIAIPLGLDADEAEVKGHHTAEKIAAEKPVMKVDADTKPGEQHLSGFQANIASIKALFHVGANTKPAEATVAASKAHIEADPLTITPKVNMTPGEATVADFQSMFSHLHGQIEDIDAQNAINRLGAEAEEEIPPHFDRAGEESATRFGNALRRGISGLAGVIGVAAGAFIAGALVKGFDRLNTIEDATAALTVQLGSATEAAELLDDVLGVVRGTPFNLDQFAKAAADMVAFGISTQKIPGYLTAIGEAAASQGGRANEVAQRLSLIFGQITTANRIGGQELLQFSEAGVNALTILGNAFGKTTTEIRDMISQGAVPAKQALDILSEGILHGSTGVAGTTVAFAGTMAKLRETLTGAIGGFSAATARFGVELIEPFKDGLVAAFQGATEVIDNFGKKVHAAFAGIAESDFGKRLIDDLKNLPELIDRVSKGLGAIGPALAPIAGFIGASGLGGLKSVLGEFGRFIPEFLTNPIIAATVAFVAFTPEVRDALLPVLQELVGIVGEVSAVVGDAVGKISKALVPVFVKLVAVVEQLVPVFGAVVETGEAIAAVVVPIIETLAAVISKIPVSVLTALTAAFLALKTISVLNSGLIAKGANVVGSAFSMMGVAGVGAADSIEETARKTGKAMHGMEAAVIGGLSGIALASEDMTTRVTGAAGALGALALGATAGPFGIAAAGIGIAAGIVTGHFIEQARAAAAVKAEIDALSKKYTDQTIELIKDNEALERWLKLSDSARGNKALGALFLDGTEKGKEFSAMLNTLGLASSGAAGETALGNILAQLDQFNGSIAGSPQLMAALNAQFGAAAPLVANLTQLYLDQGMSFSNLQEDLKSARDGDDFIPASGASLEQLDALNDALGANKGSADELFNALFKVFNLATSPGSDPTNVVRQGLKEFIDSTPLAKAAFDIITKGQVDLNDASLTYGQISKLNDQILIATSGHAKDLTLAQLNQKAVTNALIGQQIEEQFVIGRTADGIANLGTRTTTITQKMIDDWQHVADVNNLDLLDVVPAGAQDLVQVFIDARARAAELGVEVEDLPPVLDEAAIAAKNLAATVLLSAEAARQVGIEFDKLKAKIGDRTDTLNLISDLRGVSEGFGKIINESDVKAAESANKSLKDSADRIAQLQLDVAKEADDAAAKAVDLKDRIERDRALGAVGGVARLEFELAHVNDKTIKKQAELDKAIAGAGEAAGKAGAKPITALEELLAQAKERHLTLFDLLLSGATPEAIAAFNANIAPVVNSTIAAFQAEVEKHPENAKNLATWYRQTLLTSLLEGGLDPETAQKFVNSFFGPTDTGAIAAAVAKSTAALKEEYTARLRKDFEEDPELGDLTAKLLTVKPGSEAADSIIESLRKELLKHQIDVGEAITPLTDADVAQFFSFLEDPDLKPLDIVSMEVTGDLNITGDVNLTPGSMVNVLNAVQQTANELPPIQMGTEGHVITPPEATKLQYAWQSEVDHLPLIVMGTEGHVITPPEADTLHHDYQVEVDKLPPVTIPAKLAVKLDEATTEINKWLTLLHLPTIPVVPAKAPAPDVDPVTGRPIVGIAQGGIIHFGRGAAGSESHLADIVTAGTYRVFAEPETYGEGYIPLSPFKRERSTGVLGTIADMFGLELIPKDILKAKVPLPSALTGGRGLTPDDADLIGAAVARHTKPTNAERADEFARRLEQGVHFEPGSIIVQESSNPRRTASTLVSRLADLAFKRH